MRVEKNRARSRVLVLSLLPSMLSTVALLRFQPAAFAQYTADKAGLDDGVHDYKKSWWESLIVDKYYTFKLSPGCWAKLTEKDGWGIQTVANSVTEFSEYAKKMGWGDFEAAESANNNDRDNNKPRVQEMVDGLNGKFSSTLIADGIKCTDAEWDLVHRIWYLPFEALSNGSWKPKFAVVHLTVTFTPAAKDISVVVNPDGKQFAITCPSQVEPSDWDAKIIKGLNRPAK